MNTFISKTITARAIKLGDNVSYCCTQVKMAIDVEKAYNSQKEELLSV